MDAVELAFPVDVSAASKLMGSESFLRAGITVKEAEDPGSDHDSIIVTHPISSCLIEKGNVVVPYFANVENDIEFLSWDALPETELCKNSSRLACLQSEEMPKNVHDKEKNCPIITSRHEGMPIQQKAGKVIRSNSSCSKRPRISQSEDSAKMNGIDKSKDIWYKLGSNHINSSSLEKSQLPKQKRNANKRGDKRNFRLPSKAKFDLSSMKLGAAISSSACGVNNFFGLYGLKHDIHDVTTLVDELPLDKLLSGTFDCPSLSKDKGRKASNTSESYLNLVRKACSILQFPKPVQSQNMLEMDSSSNKNISACQLSSVGVMGSGGNGNQGQSCAADMYSCQKDSCSDTETPANLPNFPLYQPKNVLERIALPTARDLESLLLDASKPAVTTKISNDLQIGKQVSRRRPSLPAFPWSNAFGGHCRNNSDTVKLSTSRSTCQGQWARIGVIASSMSVDRGSFMNLDSFSYDQSLVPSTSSSDSQVSPSLCASIPFWQWDSSSPVTCSKASQFTEDGHCPRLLAAAKTLYEIATNSPRQIPDGIMRSRGKTLHKTTKPRNLKSKEKLEEAISTPISMIGSDLVVRSVEHIMSSKKPRLSTVENKDGDHSSNVKKGPCTWPASKSCRSLSSKSFRNSILENKHSTPSILKQHCMKPPPARVVGKACDNQQKVRKLVFLDWKRGKDKSD